MIEDTFNSFLLNKLISIKEHWPIRILVTAAGSASAINVILSLRRVENVLNMSKGEIFKIIAVDKNELSPGFYLSDGYDLVPDASDDLYFDKIKEILLKNKIDVLIPINSNEIRRISALKNRFIKELDINLMISPKKTLEMLDDKFNFMEFVENSDYNIPLTEILIINEKKMKRAIDLIRNGNVGNIKLILEDIVQNKIASKGYPFVIKKRIGSGSKSCWIVRNHIDLLNFMYHVNLDDIKNKEYIIQEFIEGKEITVDFCCDSRGKFIGCVIRERIQVRDGKSFKANTIYDRLLIDIIKSIVEDIGYIGVGNVQCIIRKEGSGNEETQIPYFIEFNPRFAAGGLPLTVHVGFNIPLLFVLLSLNPALEFPVFEEYPSGVKMLRFLDSVFTF